MKIRMLTCPWFIIEDAELDLKDLLQVIEKVDEFGRSRHPTKED